MALYCSSTFQSSGPAKVAERLPCADRNEIAICCAGRRARLSASIAMGSEEGPAIVIAPLGCSTLCAARGTAIRIAPSRTARSNRCIGRLFLPHHHVRGLDDSSGLVPDSQSQLVDCLIRDR